MAEGTWEGELQAPSAAFFEAFVQRVREVGAEAAVRTAVERLVPAVAWEAALPLVPRGPLGLGAASRLRPHLAEVSSLRPLATQLHAFAGEARRRDGLPPWAPAEADFEAVLRLCAPDMVNVGHKGVVACQLQDLERALGGGLPVLLDLTAWLAEAEPRDRSWHARVVRRLEAGEGPAPGGDLARAVCDGSHLEALDAVCGCLRAGEGPERLRDALARAATARMVDARPELEGRTAWLLVYLAAADRMAVAVPAVWAQAAALINFFPSEEPEDRMVPRAPAPSADPAQALLDALLDGEAEAAMAAVPLLEAARGWEAALAVLAEAASTADPQPGHGAQLLAVAAAADLAPGLAAETRSSLLAAVAKSLARSPYGSGLGRAVDRLLA